MYIAIEGVIGVGKTSLVRLLRPKFGAEGLLEVFEENPFLSSFYGDRERYAFQTQMFFLLSRYHQQRRAVPETLARAPLIADYTFAKDALFARINLKGDELELYDNLHNALAEKIPMPDLIVYLRASTATLMQRIARRDRPYERQMEDTYIDELNHAYDSFFAHHLYPTVLTIDVDNLDFVARPEDLQLVETRIRSALKVGAYQQPLLLKKTMLVIERATLLKIAREAAAQRLAARRSLLSAYLTGSVAAGEPLLGEATDIDLIFIDAEPPPVAREIVRLTDQVALDIQFRPKSEYANAKTLRVHPWRGPEICAPFFLLDPTHFFELAQANVRGQFYRSDFVAARARAFVTLAQDAFHVGLLPGQESSEPVTLEVFCRGLLYAANALISLSAVPGAGRRLLLKLEAAGQKLKREDLHTSFLALFGDEPLDSRRAKTLLQGWGAAYRAGQSVEDELVHPARRTIYERGFTAQMEADRAAEMLWLMLYTWQALLKNLPGDSPHADLWLDFLRQVQMSTLAEFAARVEQARAYVALIAETVESWAEQNGA